MAKKRSFPAPITILMVVIILAAACTWIAFSKQFGRDRRMAVLLTATLIAAPHSSYYDLVLLVAGALLLYREMLDGIAVLPRPLLLMLPWYAPLAVGPRSWVLGFGVPMVILGVLLILLRPARQDGLIKSPEGKIDVTKLA